MKATEHYFPMVLFIMMYKMVYLLSLWTKLESVTIWQMKATEKYFLVMLFIMLHKVEDVDLPSQV